MTLDAVGAEKMTFVALAAPLEAKETEAAAALVAQGEVRQVTVFNRRKGAGRRAHFDSFTALLQLQLIESLGLGAHLVGLHLGCYTRQGVVSALKAKAARAERRKRRRTELFPKPLVLFVPLWTVLASLLALDQGRNLLLLVRLNGERALLEDRHVGWDEEVR